MKESLYSALKPVRSRQQMAFVLRTSLGGLLVGSVAGVIFGLGRLFLGWPVSWEASLGLLAGGLVLGLLTGLVLRRRWHQAAAAVDQHYRLKDRSVTALEFLTKPDRGDLHDLQIADTVDHLHRVEPEKVVPLQAPRSLTAAAGLALGLAVLALFWPLRLPEADAAPA